mgnify:CR=1 FL=1
MAHYLVIVESPAKVKTIKKFLGSNYTVAAFQGHVRDLPKSSLGIDVEHDYEPKYITIRGKGDISEFVNKYKESYEKSQRKGLICIPSGNHDMDRLAKRLNENELKIAFAFLLSMPGAPFIYYGDEIGMKYIDNLESVEGGYDRTGSRSPMQWDNSTNAGFSCAPSEKLYIPVDISQELSLIHI